MPRPKNKKPSYKLKATMELLWGLTKEEALLVWDGKSVKTVTNVRFGHDEESVPTTIILDT